MNRPLILHILVVGFHHKKGCQVEYCYPLGNEKKWLDECEWKSVPTLALPDGSHNFNEDVVYFNLPRNRNNFKSIFGISCFKQIDVNKLKNRTDDLTRTSVQKSVCILSSIPLFGKIKVHIASVTRAYFDAGDFTKVALLKDAFDNLSYCLTNSKDNLSAHYFLGLPTRNLFFEWQQKTLLLFKLLLLEKRVLFHYSPVKPLCVTIATLISLFPGVFENGLENCNYFLKNEIEFEDEMCDDQIKNKCPLFHKQNLFFPYLSLGYLDHLEECTNSGYVVGSTNILFKHKKQQIADIFVDIDNLRIEYCCPFNETDLKKQLTLTVHDLRFCDFLMTHFRVLTNTMSVSDQKHEEIWLREQMENYLVNMLKVAVDKNSMEEDKFNSNFLDAWRKTDNFWKWFEFYSGSNFYENLEAEHPAAKNLSNSSITDVKLKFNNFLQNNDNCRKINEAVTSTNRAMTSTGKVVGGAISSAKDSITNWWVNRKSHNNSNNLASDI